MIKTDNDLQELLSQELDKMSKEYGDSFSVEKINLAELSRRTGISRQRLRRLKKNNFVVMPNGNKGKKKDITVLTGYTDTIDYLLGISVTNSSVIFDRLKENGYKGSLTSIKDYIKDHKHLIPAKRQIVSPQGNRGIRYTTKPGECFQMDWGFVKVISPNGTEYQVSCFAMICHHCGQRYIEFFTNASGENLLIGMVHAFIYLGIPKRILTDNMKSIVIKKDADKKPIWQKDYEAFMKTVGFDTTLCKVRHPFTKGKVERLIRFVKDNFVAGRVFGNLTELNYQALDWCKRQNTIYHACIDGIPNDIHNIECNTVTKEIVMDKALMYYLCPERKISFDGFVNFEGRRFGVPYWYREKSCRISRKDFEITIYSRTLDQVLAIHNVTWSKKDSYCKDQYVTEMIEELPTAAVTSTMYQIEEKAHRNSFDKFSFSRMVKYDE